MPKPLKKKLLSKKLPAAPRDSYYDPKTGVMTLHPVKEPVTFGESIAHAMGRLGGKEGLAHWARHNPGHFYTLAARTLPLELAGKDGGPVEVTFVDPLAAVARKSLEKDVTPKGKTK